MKTLGAIDVSLTSSAWVIGVSTVSVVLLLCLTCIVLVTLSRSNAPEVLRAFADVVRAVRRRPRRSETNSD